MESSPKEVVCVTGGSGFIGSWLVRLLLDRGYTVHATVKDLKNEKETKHLETLKLEGAESRLHLFQIDLLDYDSIVAVINGTVGIFHLASPVIVYQVPDPEREILEPAIKGKINVLKAAKEGGVRRVVVTSSVSAIVPSRSWPANVVKGEDCWADPDYCKQNGVRFRSWLTLTLVGLMFFLANMGSGAWKVTVHDWGHLDAQQLTPTKIMERICYTQICLSPRDLTSRLTPSWYSASKILAEKAAWEFAKEKGLDVVVVNPGTVMGPLCPPTINASMSMLLHLLEGCTEVYEEHFMGIVHVKDVALAHILLYENQSASGRHLCVEAISHYSDFAAKVAELYPEYEVPRFPKDTQPGLLRAKNASKKLIDMGLQFTSMEQIIKDSVESLKSKGYIS